jgi:hypothetical protein
MVFLALLVGTGVTVGASYVDLGIWNTPVAMLIAVTKASLVVFFFMHLKYSPRLYWSGWGRPCSSSPTAAGHRAGLPARTCT